MSSNKADSSGPSDPSRTSPSISSDSASNPNSTSTSTTTSAQPRKPSGPQYPGLSANFAHDPKAPFPVNYDQEVYLQLMAGDDGTGDGAGGPGTGSTSNGAKKNKTPTQIYREKWVRRALNPAISDPRGEPSSIDFECAENRRVSDRF